MSVRPTVHLDDRLVVYVDAECGICSLAGIWLRRLDVLGRLHVVALQDAMLDASTKERAQLAEVLHARDDSGRWWTGAAACLQVAQRVPLLWGFALLGRIPAAARLMDRAYRRVARDRTRLSVRLGLADCRMPR
jgi:predicted DCC family thiol-disulfide oxidoreductase YuxK